MPKFTIIDTDQRSEAWFQGRLGRLTGSRAGDMLATIKSGEAAARRNLKIQLVLERLTGKPQENGYCSPAMQAGIEREPDAIARYELLTGQPVQTTGFLACDDLQAGCSLDGHVAGMYGIVEVKCPQPAAHLAILRSHDFPAEHLPQAVHNLWISGARWCDLVSYQPDFPKPLQLVIRRLLADEPSIAKYDLKAHQFLAEVDRELDALRTMTNLSGILAESVA